ncbi:hypothetical protein [Rhodococcus marinonascens]|uniref:hypothetical protein n=1 Tax=Rhodococcus marinonascens TaxID=38311 RepID=UPI0009346365|nr:hypothetical protein [Rhodococcus marinonascens]
MIRTVATLLAPAALLLGACSSESDTHDTESVASATTEASEASSADLPTVADLCNGLLRYASSAEDRAQQNGETFDRTATLDDLFEESAETQEWKDASQERRDQMIKAYSAAETGAC